MVNERESKINNNKGSQAVFSISIGYNAIFKFSNGKNSQSSYTIVGIDDAREFLWKIESDKIQIVKADKEDVSVKSFFIKDLREILEKNIRAMENDEVVYDNSIMITDIGYTICQPLYQYQQEQPPSSSCRIS